MSFHEIDLNRYARRAHFDYFRTLAYPYAGVTAEVDVTDIVRICRDRHRSFYLSFLHAAALAADDVPELRQRIREGRIVEYDECPTSHIELTEDGSYCYCTLRHHMDEDRYHALAERSRAECRKNGIREDEDAESMYFISTLPWLHYTALIQPVAGGDESNPRITWGRYVSAPDGRMLMPVSILVHHALADGIHLAQFYRNLNTRIGNT